ncbi:MAG: glycosyltransferase [Deltaproteobacteria bacterium]|nr:glycosyltransferase [Deltaproteobacteria bacterium]MBW2253291.1 glycosyltransferase [Deltaproteobacteria bacterium]
MRVLHVDTAREWRGGQTQLLLLLRANPHHEVALPPDAPLRPAAEGLGIRVHPVSFHGPWRGTKTLARLIRARGPDLVAAHTSHAHGHALLAGGAPLVVHRRLDFRPGVLSRLKYRGPRGYVAVSQAVKGELSVAGVAPERIEVVHDGVDPEPFLDAEPIPLRDSLRCGPNAVLVGAVGALVPHKGHAVLVDAMAILRSSGVPAVAVIAGEGKLRGTLVRQIRRRGLEGVVHLLGHRHDVPGLLGAIDVMCHPSLEEGMGQAVVEAMLAGTPVVASAAGGIPEVVEHETTGRLVPPGVASELARGLTQAIATMPATRRFAEKARTAARARFGPERMVRGTLAAYHRFLTVADL